MNKAAPGIEIIQGDTCIEEFVINKDGQSLDDSFIESVFFTVKDLNINKTLTYDADRNAFVLLIDSADTATYQCMRSNYDLTVFFREGSIKTAIFNSSFNVYEKKNKVGGQV